MLLRRRSAVGGGVCGVIGLSMLAFPAATCVPCRRMLADLSFLIRGGTTDSKCQLFSCGRDNGIVDSLVDAVGLQDVSIDGVETVQEGAVPLHADIATVPQVIDGL